MSLFATTCARCHINLPEPSDAPVPTCERCASLVRAKLRVDSESMVTCPLDGTTMNKELHHDLILDQCPTCGGIWLDGGELNLLRRAMADGERTDLARNIVLGMTR